MFEYSSSVTENYSLTSPILWQQINHMYLHFKTIYSTRREIYSASWVPRKFLADTLSKSFKKGLSVQAWAAGVYEGWRARGLVGLEGLLAPIIFKLNELAPHPIFSIYPYTAHFKDNANFYRNKIFVSYTNILFVQSRLDLTFCAIMMSLLQNYWNILLGSSPMKLDQTLPRATSLKYSIDLFYRIKCNQSIIYLYTVQYMRCSYPIINILLNTLHMRLCSRFLNLTLLK